MLTKNIGSGFIFVSLISSSYAGLIDFEGLPSTYLYTGDAQNIGSYYSGVTFGPNVTGLDLTGSTAFPPHSGSIAVWDPVDLTVTIDFTDLQTMVGVWFTSIDFLTLTAFDSADTNLGSNVGTPNTDGTTGTSDLLSVSAPDIASVTLSGPPGGYVFDDLTFTPQQNSSTPEPSSGIFILIAAGCFSVFRAKRPKAVTFSRCPLN